MAKKSVKKVSAVPVGYNSITPYLIIDRAVDAIQFYKKVFGAKEVMRMGKEDGKIGHAELQIGDTKIMLADEHPEMNARAPQTYGGSPVSIHLYINNVDAVVQRAITEGATLIRPVEDMFYGDRSGGVQDPFGHIWYVSTHVEDVTPAEIRKRLANQCSREEHACKDHA
ncbi:MAG: glyoxalase [Gammaproteobacteria bacterium RIFCSPHIGHO2_02_FULL_39_13]|nr:MAG: glyoxalase [Gammaproteobacteria bacterium RIFCSPHIGHO2_02_FULL_39_13]